MFDASMHPHPCPLPEYMEREKGKWFCSAPRTSWRARLSDIVVGQFLSQLGSDLCAESFDGSHQLRVRE
jgi:hypothetical protein